MDRLDNTDENIDLFVNRLGKYWKSNKDLNFGDVVTILDSKCDLDQSNLGEGMLMFTLNKLILESCYPELRREIAQVYWEELDSLEEVDKQDLISAILKWYLSGKAYIKSTGMRILVEGYLSVKTKG